MKRYQVRLWIPLDRLVLRVVYVSAKNEMEALHKARASYSRDYPNSTYGWEVIEV